MFWSKTRAEEEFRKVWDGIWLSLFLSCAARIHILNVTYFSAALLNKFIICICLLFFFFSLFLLFFFPSSFLMGEKKDLCILLRGTNFFWLTDRCWYTAAGVLVRNTEEPPTASRLNWDAGKGNLGHLWVVVQTAGTQNQDCVGKVWSFHYLLFPFQQALYTMNSERFGRRWIHCVLAVRTGLVRGHLDTNQVPAPVHRTRACE